LIPPMPNSPSPLHLTPIHLAIRSDPPLRTSWSYLLRLALCCAAACRLLPCDRRQHRRGHFLHGRTSSVRFLLKKSVFELHSASLFLIGLVFFTDKPQTPQNVIAIAGARRYLRCRCRPTISAPSLPHPYGPTRLGEHRDVVLCLF
jgi:hypothetical protein